MIRRLVVTALVTIGFSLLTWEVRGEVRWSDAPGLLALTAGTYGFLSRRADEDR